MAHLFISAAHKSSGKTTVTLGLCRALNQRGLRVQAFKKGPDYIDPIWHGLASGRPSYNLDFHMMRESEILPLFARHAATADISLIEGNKGLYDGMDLDGSNSNAALAKLLKAPVVLVLDSVGVTRGVAPLILGYQAFDRDVRIAGVILNKVGGPRHEEKLRAVIEHYTDVKVLGAVRMDDDLSIVERHLGLIPGNEADAAEARIEAIARKITAEVDMDALLAAAKRADVITPPVWGGQVPVSTGLSLAYAHDRAFGFYYQEDLDTLREQGNQLIAVNTMHDPRLPECDGLILGGGFPEMFVEQLEANVSLRADIRHKVDAGLPTYAECGGLMYLSRTVSWEERRGEMVGIIPGDVVMGNRPVGRGYATLEETEHMPWPTRQHPIPAHEFHYSRLENLPAGLDYAYRVLRGQGIDGSRDGYVYKNLLAAYCHRRGTGDAGWIRPFLKKARAFAETRNAARLAA